MSGFGVDAGALRRVAGRYEAEAADLVALAGSVAGTVGEHQVGRAFAAVAGPYRAAVDGFGRNLARLGAEAGELAGRLAGTAAEYARLEDESAVRTVR
jgi:hypothetical protein